MAPRQKQCHCPGTEPVPWHCHRTGVATPRPNRRHHPSTLAAAPPLWHHTSATAPRPNWCHCTGTELASLCQCRTSVSAPAPAPAPASSHQHQHHCPSTEPALPFLYQNQHHYSSASVSVLVLVSLSQSQQPSSPQHPGQTSPACASTGTRVPDLVPVSPVPASLINAGSPRINIPNPILASTSLEPASLPHSHKYPTSTAPKGHPTASPSRPHCSGMV